MQVIFYFFQKKITTMPAAQPIRFENQRLAAFLKKNEYL